MKKIILTRDTMNDILHRVKKMVDSAIDISICVNNKKDSKFKIKDAEKHLKVNRNLSVWNIMFTIHDFVKNYPSWMGERKQSDIPLLYLEMTPSTTEIFYEGDEFYFNGGSKIIIRQVSNMHYDDLHKKCMFIIINRRNDLDTPQFQYGCTIRKIKEIKEMEELDRIHMCDMDHDYEMGLL